LNRYFIYEALVSKLHSRISQTLLIARCPHVSPDMTLSQVRIQTRRRMIALAILLAGFGSALVIFITVTPAPTNPLGYDPEDSKQYLRELELYGGQANVLGYEFRQWFESLWHGRRLAVTVLCLTLAAALLYWVASTPLPPQVGSSHQRNQAPT
jgi:hypothetical protein